MTTCRKGLHPWVASNIEVAANGANRCKECRRANDRLHIRRAEQRPCQCGAMFTAPGNTLMCPDCTDKAARKAAELHAAGGMSWNQVAAAVGYGSGEGARFAAKRIGYAPVPPPVKAKARPVLCQCGARAWRNGRCQDCAHTLALRAAELYNAGWTLARIGAELGFRSQSGVTNLIKTVAAIDTKMGRPPGDRVAVLSA